MEEIINKEYIKNKIKTLLQLNCFLEIFHNPNFDLEMLIDIFSDKSLLSKSQQTFDKIWNLISSNKKLTIEILRKNLSKPFNWRLVCKNPLITINDIMDNPNFPWIIDYNELSNRTFLTIEFIEKHINENWDWKKLSSNIFLTMEFIEKHVDKNWDWYELSNKPFLTMEFIKRHIDKPFDWKRIIANHNLDLELVLKYPEKNWDWIVLSLNKNLTINLILKNIDKKWNWDYISRNSNITIKDILDNPDLPWDWYWVSLNKNITIDFIKNNLSKKWNWDYISYNSNITIKDILDNPDLPWEWNFVSLNRNLTLTDVLNNIDLDWNYSNICANKNINVESAIKIIENGDLIQKEKLAKLIKKFSDVNEDDYEEEYDTSIFSWNTIINYYLEIGNKKYYAKTLQKILLTKILCNKSIRNYDSILSNNNIVKKISCY